MTKEGKKELRFKLKSERFKLKYGVSLEEIKDGGKKGREVSRALTKKMLAYYFKSPLKMIAIILLTITQIVVTFLMMPVTETMVNYVSTGDYTLAILNCVNLIIIYALLCVFGGIRDVWIRRLSFGVVEQIRVDMARQAINTTSSSYKKLSSGEVLQRVNGDPQSFSNMFLTIGDNVANIITKISFMTYFAVMHYSLICCAVGIIVVHYVLAFFQVRKKKVYEQAKSILAEKSNSQLNEIVRGSDDVKGLNLKESMFLSFKTLTGFRKRTNINSARFSIATSEFNSALIQAMVWGMVILGIYLTSTDVITIGALTVLLMYRDAPVNVANSITRVYDYAQMCGVYAIRMAKLFNEEYYKQEKFGNQMLANFSGNIEFKKVCFSYDKDVVLENVSFKVASNQSVAIVGKSGEGKSTLLSLVNRLIDCDSGEILLDHVKNTELTEEALRTNVSLVPQNPYIFNTTIRQNLLYVKPEASEEELYSVLKKAQLFDFVKNAEKGLDTVVGESGVVLSGGQRQRLALARAFLAGSKLIMLDEATSALDNKTQDGIKQVIEEMKNERAFIIVAHRLSTVVNCDKILVLDNHNIVASGTHEELMKACKIYADMYKLEKEQKSG